MNNDPVIAWLLASDPSICWQVKRDLLDAPEAEWTQDRKAVEVEGFGAKLLAKQDPDGQWAGGAFVPHDFTSKEWKEEGQPFTATFSVLSDLRELGLDPASDSVKARIQLIADNCKWDEQNGGKKYFYGETEECINGRVIADGSYFGINVTSLVTRLLSEQQQEGGWNCERCNGSTRSSFASTINVLEGLLEYEIAGQGTPESKAARLAAQEFLLQRRLFKRLSTGEPADPKFLQFLYPTRWRYDVLRALDYFRAASLFDGVSPDPRLQDAIDVVRSKKTEDGKWNLDYDLNGRVWFKMHPEGPGNASPFVTLYALRVLKWWNKQ
ncbi:UNVERIFIED_CONTAM: hypothetical protein HDU68_007944 [Siphonaria sp. JEL0065]|nr:hypothetical protein HDU68_007944 [Siphonaria sp. JEL0065]